MKSWLLDNDIEIYSTQNEGKSFVKKFIRTLKSIYDFYINYNCHIKKMCVLINQMTWLINTAMHSITQPK